MKDASMSRIAAEAMALQASERGTTVKEQFGTAYDFSFLTRGHTESESIERAVNVTPELINLAETILASWRAADRAARTYVSRA